jgi:hypothetical protein
MQDLTPAGQQLVSDAANRHGFSQDAVRGLLSAIGYGGGTMAQFNHLEFGGMGQWSPGMIMIGDMFNNGLKFRVESLCRDLADGMRGSDLFAAPAQVSAGGGGSGHWWPAGLGSPSSSGGQNDMRYAVFPQSRRLAVQSGGNVAVYDTGDHSISGVSQQQAGTQTLSFSSQFGQFSTLSLPLIHD